MSWRSIGMPGIRHFAMHHLLLPGYSRQAYRLGANRFDRSGVPVEWRKHLCSHSRDQGGDVGAVFFRSVGGGLVVIFNLPISNHTQLFFLFPLVIIAKALKTLFTCWSLTYLLISLCVS